MLYPFVCLAQDTLAKQTYGANEILVRWRDLGAKTMVGAADQLNRMYALEHEERLFPKLRGSAKRGSSGTVLEGWYLLRFAGGVDAAIIAREYAALPEIEYAEPNYLRRFTGVPNDSLWSQQWNLTTLGWSAIGPTAANKVIVGLVDSGLDLDHADLLGQLWINASEAAGQTGIDDDGNGYIDDINGWDFTDAPSLPGQGDYLERDAYPQDESGHGSHVGGIIAATVDNGIGIAGVSSGVELMALRAGFNTSGGGYLEDDDIAAAIVYAVDNGAQIINMSFGDPQESVILRDVVRYAVEAGCMLVAAAGNEGDDNVFYPARYNLTIAVAATGRDNRVLGFSNYGPSIDLAAPGQDIWSLGLGGQYIERSGTSMAAPHVTGLAALLLARQPQWSVRQVQAALERTAKDINVPGRDNRSGAGLVQAAVLTLNNSPSFTIKAPLDGAYLGDETSIVIGLEEEGIDRLEVNWGRGIKPSIWHELGSDEVNGRRELVFNWKTVALSADRYIIQVLGYGAGVVLEDRVEVVVEGEVTVQKWQLQRVLDGEHWRWLVDWSTDRPSRGKVMLKGPETFTIEALTKRSRQRLTLPKQLMPGDYEVEIIPDQGMGVFEHFTEKFQAVKSWNLDQLGKFPDGFLLPQMTDFNRNGLGEIVQMGYYGSLYNRTDFFELSSNTQPVFSSDRLFIPWNVHDLDADGKEELMAVDAQRVRLLEVLTEGEFPSQVVWQQDDVWGGQHADLDGDGEQEMFLRSSRADLFRVFESSGDNAFAERALVTNPTQGENTLGQRQVIGDLDGDGRGDFLVGDGDGDLFIVEEVGNDVYRTVWQQLDRRELGDARIIGGGSDLDGDGRNEFIVARRFQTTFDLPGRFWTLEVYQAVGDDAYALEWSVEVLGGKIDGNGIAMGDLDSNGLPEWTVALPPHLYVIRSSGIDSYVPVWYAPATDTQRPSMGYLNAAAGLVMAYNNDGVRLVRVPVEDTRLVAPTQLRVHPLSKTHLVGEWEAVEGAHSYRVYRDGVALPLNLEITHFEDHDFKHEGTVEYAVVAVDTAGREGRMSNLVRVKGEEPPVLLQVERQGRHHIALLFNAAVADPDGAMHRFVVEPKIGQPSSVLNQYDGLQLLLGFTDKLPALGDYVIHINGIKSKAGTPLYFKQEFTLQPFQKPGRILKAQILDPERILVRFNYPIVLPVNASATFFFDDPSVIIDSVSRGDVGEVILQLTRGLRPLGRSFRLTVNGLEDENGQKINGEVVVRFAPDQLGEVSVYPNPFYPTRGGITFGGLPAASQVMIFALDGSLVRLITEVDSDGGVQWDGTNAKGKVVGAGVYLFKIIGPVYQRSGKLVVCRE